MNPEKRANKMTKAELVKEIEEKDRRLQTCHLEIEELKAAVKDMASSCQAAEGNAEAWKKCYERLKVGQDHLMDPTDIAERAHNLSCTVKAFQKAVDPEHDTFLRMLSVLRGQTEAMLNRAITVGNLERQCRFVVKEDA